MGAEHEIQSTVVRTGRGLSIAGTRITLYNVMDYLKADWPPKLIQEWLNLTDEQIADVMAYISLHSEEVEAEYQLVLQEAEENRRYWEAYNRERFGRIAATSFKSRKDALRAKIQAQKVQPRAL